MNVLLSQQPASQPCHPEESSAPDKSGLIQALRQYIYQGASVDAVSAVVLYCNALGLDPFMRPVRIVAAIDEQTGTGRELLVPTNAIRSDTEE